MKIIDAKEGSENNHSKFGLGLEEDQNIKKLTRCHRIAPHYWALALNRAALMVPFLGEKLHRYKRC